MGGGKKIHGCKESVGEIVAVAIAFKKKLVGGEKGGRDMFFQFFGGGEISRRKKKPMT